MPDTKKSSFRISPKKLSNLKVVVLCVVAATTFWILNALNKDDYTTVVDYPIELVFDQEKYVPVADLPKSVQVEINGNGWDLLRKYFNVNEAPFPIELENPASKDYLLTSNLKRSLAEFLTPTQLISVLDDSLTYRIDRIQTARLRPVLDSSSYTLATNHRLISNITFEPNQITLRGAKSILESFEGEFSIFLDEKKISSDISKEVELILPKDLRKYITLEDESVKVSFQVVGFLEGNQRLTVNKRNFPDRVSLENEEASFVFYYLVDSREVEKFSEIEFEAILDYSARNREDSTVTVQVSPNPNYLEIIRVEPSMVKLRYD
ncbi:YbbR-like domain-containing protein [Algoriphagus namhaensis]